MKNGLSPRANLGLFRNILLKFALIRKIWASQSVYLLICPVIAVPIIMPSIYTSWFHFCCWQKYMYMHVGEDNKSPFGTDQWAYQIRIPLWQMKNEDVTEVSHQEIVLSCLLGGRPLWSDNSQFWSQFSDQIRVHNCTGRRICSNSFVFRWIPQSWLVAESSSWSHHFRNWIWKGGRGNFSAGSNPW